MGLTGVGFVFLIPFFRIGFSGRASVFARSLARELVKRVVPRSDRVRQKGVKMTGYVKKG